MELNLPATVFVSNDLVSLINSLPSVSPSPFIVAAQAAGLNVNKASWDAIATELFTLGDFYNNGISIDNLAIATGSHWISKDGKCTFECNLTTWSDPLTQQDMIVIASAAAAVLVALILAIIGNLPGLVIGLLLTALALVGVISVAAVFVSLLSEILPNPNSPAGQALWIAVAVALGGAGTYLLVKGLKGQKKSP